MTMESLEFFFKLNYNHIPNSEEMYKKIKEVVASMEYEDFRNCELEDLIELAGIKEEIELAEKQEKVKEKLKGMNEDFK